MATIVKALDTVCTLDWDEEHEWTCDGPEAELLSESFNAHLVFFAPSGADPNPPYTHAQDMAELYSGEVLEFDEVPFDPDVVY